MHRPRRRPRTPDPQPDLFPASLPAASSPATRWIALPDQTRHAVTMLMTRLLIAHAGGAVPELGSDGDER